ncbi:MAG: TetR/AcrR family transcriptional regulator [Actinomycetota bacterium]
MAPAEVRGGGATEATVASLLDAAEERFAADGFQRASLRAVMRTAGADPGAVHYHFGGRPALAGAVLDRVLAPLNASRLERLTAARSRWGAAPIPLPALVDALIRPDLDVAADLERRGPGRARLVGLIYLEPAAFVTERVEAHFAPVAAAFMPELLGTLPGIAPDEVAWRIRWVVFGTLGAVLSDPTEAAGHTPDRLAERLIPSLAAALDPTGRAKATADRP